jgi:hypothetical protein
MLIAISRERNQMPKLNLSDLDEGFTDSKVNPLVDDGIYRALVTGASFEIDDRGREKIITDFKVTEDGPAKGLVFRSWNYLHQSDCKRITIENLSNIGVPPNWNYKNVKILLNKECRIELVPGEGYMNVKSIRQRFIPNGVYTTVVNQVGKLEHSHFNNTPFRRVFFKIISEPRELAGLSIQERLFLTDKSLKVTASKLKAIGSELPDFDTDQERDWASLTGLRVEISYTNSRTSDGKEYGRVVSYKALGRGNSNGAASNPVASATEVSGGSDAANSPGMVASVSAEDIADMEDEIPF